MNNLIELADSLIERGAEKFVLSGKKNADNKYKRININKKLISKELVFQLEKYTDTQVFHENIGEDELKDALIKYMEGFKNINAYSPEESIEVRISKKGKIFLSSKKQDNKSSLKEGLSHNKKKNYILKEGELIEPLIELGIFTKDGKIISSSYDKYKQINRFTEFLDEVIAKSRIETGRRFNIIDFGCGKSYLSFIVYYYFKIVKNIDVNIVGLDLKADVIENCNKIVKKFGYDGLRFEVGNIDGYKPDERVDMIITLHACDTATDFAIYNAIKWDCKYVYSVPCCQHEFNATIKNDRLKALTDFGIVKERIAALMTDAVRGELLKACGYKTQLLEFIEVEHSPKNILIRAIKGDISEHASREALIRAQNVIEDFNVSSTLYNLLKEDGLI